MTSSAASSSSSASHTSNNTILYLSYSFHTLSSSASSSSASNGSSSGLSSAPHIATGTSLSGDSAGISHIINTGSNGTSTASQSARIQVTPTLILQSEAQYQTYALTSLALPPQRYSIQGNDSLRRMSHASSLDRNGATTGMNNVHSSSTAHIGNTNVLLTAVECANVPINPSNQSSGASSHRRNSNASTTNRSVPRGSIPHPISNHFLFTNSPRTFREICQHKWISEIVERWDVRDAKAFYLPKFEELDRHNRNQRGDGNSASTAAHQEPLHGPDSTTSATTISNTTDEIIAIVRMDSELALWIKMQSKWICFARFQAVRLKHNAQANGSASVHSRSSSRCRGKVWSCGENGFLYDYKLDGTRLILCYGATEESDAQSRRVNTATLKETKKRYNEMNSSDDQSRMSHQQKYFSSLSGRGGRSSPAREDSSYTGKGLLGIAVYDLAKVRTIVSLQLEMYKKLHMPSKYACQLPESHRILDTHESHLVQITMNLHGKLVATASERGTLLRLTDTSTGKALLELQRGSSTSVIHSIAFSPSSRYLCCTSSSGTLHVYDLPLHSMMDGNADTSQPARGGGGSGVWEWVTSKMPGNSSRLTSTWKYKSVPGRETLCMMPSDSSIFIINDLGELLHLSFDPTKREEDAMLTLLKKYEFF